MPSYWLIPVLSAKHKPYQKIVVVLTENDSCNTDIMKLPVLWSKSGKKKKVSLHLCYGGTHLWNMNLIQEILFLLLQSRTTHDRGIYLTTWDLVTPTLAHCEMATWEDIADPLWGEFGWVVECKSEESVEQTVEFLVIWNDMMLCDVSAMAVAVMSLVRSGGGCW